MNDRVNSTQDRRLLLAEGPRVISEIASLMAVAPFLYHAPRGDGHPVLVLPGFGAGDRSTTVIRGFLTSLGYRARPWELGTNLGPAIPDLMVELAARLDEVFVAAGEVKVSLIGWSLGGVYARLLAHRYTNKVRQVITLGSPFAGGRGSTSVNPAARNNSGVEFVREPSKRLRRLAGEPLPGVPSTAVFSKSDGIVPWQIATQQPTAIAENIEVYVSHLGLGFNPAVLYAMADRLANRDGTWRPFARFGWKRFVYGPARLEPDDSPSPGRVYETTAAEH
ncbi:MAG: alpha/beta hydrolase [Gammaproteobacteria bacterium]|nr:alpha/beta hydrolase [Gammaproteobacteria bacterium]